MSSYYKRRFYRNVSYTIFFLMLFAQPIIGLIGLGLFYFSMLQVVGLVPISVTFELNSFYYSQSAIKVNLNAMDQYEDSFIIEFEHGPILSPQEVDPSPWYQRLGFVKYRLKNRDTHPLIHRFSGYFTTGHYYDYHIKRGSDEFLTLSGETHPISYTHQTVLTGSWESPPTELPYAFKNLIFVYDDPVTWARVRVPNIYLKASELRVGDTFFKDIDCRLTVDKPDIKTSVYGSLSIKRLDKEFLKLRHIAGDLAMIDANTFYVQEFGEFFLKNLRGLLDSRQVLSWDLTADELIEAFEKLYPNLTNMTISAIDTGPFDLELRQSKGEGLEIITVGYPQDLESAMSALPVISWDKSLTEGLAAFNIKNHGQAMVTVLWNPGQEPSLEFFATPPDNPKLDEG